jgi:hypothetical protein
MKMATTATLSAVMRGLDPRIHYESPRRKALRPSLRVRLMDCRVKPGNDRGEAVTVLLRRDAGTA